MKVFIAGFTGTGKTTISKNVADKFNLSFYPASTLFKEFAQINSDTKGYWTHEGLKFIKERVGSDVDQKFDKHLLDIVDSNENFVMDSWTMPWLYKQDALRILLHAPYEIRVKRILDRDNHDLTSARKAVFVKDHQSKMIYLQKYGFDISKDWNVFDLIVNTQYMDQDEVTDYITNYIKKYKEYFG